MKLTLANINCFYLLKVIFGLTCLLRPPVALGIGPQSHLLGGGNGVGNGGDELRLQFKRAQDIVSRQVRELNSCSLSTQSPPEAGRWLLENKLKIAEDILNSPHEWLESNEQKTCAWTTRGFKDKILFSFDVCAKTTFTISAISRLLVHESVHHFDIDNENFADDVASAFSSSRQISNCPSETSKPFIRSGMWHTLAVNADQTYFVDYKGVSAPFPEKWWKPRGHLKDAVIGHNICALEDEGINCSDERTGLAWLPEHFQTVGPVYAIYASSTDPYSLCWIDLMGLACHSNSHYLNGRFPEAQNIASVAITESRLCYLSLNKVFCKDGSSFYEVEGLHNPRVLTASLSSLQHCVLDDLGIQCWTSQPTLKHRIVISDVTWPEQLVVTSDRTCIFDQRQILCVKDFGPEANKLQVVGRDLPPDTLISLQARKLCLYSVNIGLKCID